MSRVYRKICFFFIVTICFGMGYWIRNLIFYTDSNQTQFDVHTYSISGPPHTHVDIRTVHDGKFDPTEYNLRMIVIAYNRPSPLLRLLDSLNAVDYLNDSIKLEVWLDRSKKNNSIHSETYDVARNFHFKYGDYEVIKQDKHVGIYGQWIDTWKPQENSQEIAVILEDDLTVSSHFYKFLKIMHRKYDNHSNINGYTLNGMTMKHSGASGFLQAPVGNNVFLYPVLGTWGFSPNRDQWIDFVKWYYYASMDKSFVPDVPGLVTSSWYKEYISDGVSENMWSQWHIYHAWKNHLFTLYPNLPNYTGFATSWKNSGLHYSANGKPDLLWDQWDDRFDILPDNPIHLDANGHVHMGNYEFYRSLYIILIICIYISCILGCVFPRIMNVICLSAVWINIC